MKLRTLTLMLIVAALAWNVVDFEHGPPRPYPHDPSRLDPNDRYDEQGLKRFSGAMLAMDWWASLRAYPSVEFPARGWAAGFEQARKLPKTASAGKAWTDWEPIGPGNIGGRMVCVAFNPQNPSTVWAGSASGGVWRSYTGGVGVDAWERIETGHPVLGVSSIAFAPGDSSTVYIGTGEVYGYGAEGGGIALRITRGSYGIGVLKSNNGGATWGKSLDWTGDQNRGVQVVRVDPIHPDVVWAGTSEGTYKSLNAGRTWAKVHDALMTTDLVIHHGNPDVVVLACGNLGSTGYGLYRTVDGGDSWTKLEEAFEIPYSYNGKAELAISASDPDVIMASIGKSSGGATGTWLVRSEDAGATWELQTTLDYSLWQGWFAHDVAIHPQDPDIVLTAGIDIWRSTTGGSALVRQSFWQNWTFGITPLGGPEGPSDYSHADHHDIVWHPSDPNIVYFANDGGIFRSMDAGMTFEACNGGLQTTQFYAGFSVSRTSWDFAMGGLQDNSTAMYHGDGAWSKNIGGDGSWTAIHAADDSLVYGSWQSLNVLRSPDRGGSWYDVTIALSGTPGFIAPYALGGPSDPDVGYAGSEYMGKSINGGASYQMVNGNLPLNGDPALAIAVAPTDGDVAYVTTAPIRYPAGVFRTLNGGVDFQNVTGNLPDRYPVGLAVDPVDPMTVYVTYAGFGTGHLFRSTDAGDNWTDLTGNLPDVPTLSVIVDPLHRDHIYVGNDLGVFFSRDDGASWYDLSDGLGDAVMAMDLNVTADDKLLVSTYGNGAYTRLLERETTATGDAPAVVRAMRNAPNPFNPSTSILFSLAEAGHVELRVYDLRGAKVRTLAGRVFEAGDHAVEWNGRDDADRMVSGGSYIAKLSSGGVTSSVTMQMIK